MKRKNHKPSETEFQSTKKSTRKKMFSPTRPDQQMGVRHSRIDEVSGEVIDPSSAQKSFLKQRTARKRRQKENYSEDQADEV